MTTYSTVYSHAMKIAYTPWKHPCYIMW